jgi:DNA-binding NtrC family response regulator
MTPATILVVVDEEVLRTAYNIILTGKVYSVLLAENASVTLHILRTNKIDMILHDYPNVKIVMCRNDCTHQRTLVML